VALKLLDAEAQVPEEHAAVVAAELRLIETHAGFERSPLFVYREDYSQYVPRGHYTRSVALQRYFKAMAARATARSPRRMIRPRSTQDWNRNLYWGWLYVLKSLLALSIKELSNEPLAAQEYAWIRDIAVALEQTVLGVQSLGMKTTLVADVHTDANSAMVLEEGVGQVDLVAVVIRQPDGTLSLALGPVLSYYEFKWPMSDRLTDESWREKLAAQPAPRPAWTAAFVQ
jgi:hypothetical protein